MRSGCGIVPLSVLVADDEKIIADTLALILRSWGFDATAVYSGLDAVAAAKHIPPDLFISDIVMDGVDGIQAARTIRKIAPLLKIIFITGGPGPDPAALTIVDGREQHTPPLLTKPFRPDQLHELIDSLLAATEPETAHATHA